MPFNTTVDEINQLLAALTVKAASLKTDDASTAAIQDLLALYAPVAARARSNQDALALLSTEGASIVLEVEALTAQVREKLPAIAAAVAAPAGSTPPIRV
jgi:hypothetical protein